jgi:hypothetical protein
MKAASDSAEHSDKETYSNNAQYSTRTKATANRQSFFNGVGNNDTAGNNIKFKMH